MIQMRQVDASAENTPPGVFGVLHRLPPQHRDFGPRIERRDIDRRFPSPRSYPDPPHSNSECCCSTDAPPARAAPSGTGAQIDETLGAPASPAPPRVSGRGSSIAWHRCVPQRGCARICASEGPGRSPPLLLAQRQALPRPASAPDRAPGPGNASAAQSTRSSTRTKAREPAVSVGIHLHPLPQKRPRREARSVQIGMHRSHPSAADRAPVAPCPASVPSVPGSTTRTFVVTPTKTLIGCSACRSSSASSAAC